MLILSVGKICFLFSLHTVKLINIILLIYNNEKFNIFPAFIPPLHFSCYWLGHITRHRGWNTT